MQQGGGFINVTNAAGLMTALLITQNSTITVQRVPIAQARPGPWTQLLAVDAFTYEDF